MSDDQIFFEEYFDFPFVNLSFEGGGNKGMAYVGALRVNMAICCSIICFCRYYLLFAAYVWHIVDVTANQVAVYESLNFLRGLGKCVS